MILPRMRRAQTAWRRRIAILGGAISVGLVAIAFAATADRAGRLFDEVVTRVWWLPLIGTPAAFALIAALTIRFAPAAAGSGIPQIIAAERQHDPSGGALVSIRTAIAKFALTALGLACGASVGREGPTVQIGAAVMAASHRLARLPVRQAVLIAGGAAGVGAAFNTPLAGVAFAIEELAATYEQKLTLLVMSAVLIAGMVAQGISGDYVYFGLVGQTLPLRAMLLLAPLAGLVGGLSGGAFARAMLALVRWSGALPARRRIAVAALCGLVVALLGVATGLTWGTGYEPARAIIDGSRAPLWFGPAKFAATLATAAAGLPGGIFAPSLATGAGIGNLLRPLFPAAPGGAVVLLGMVAYFTGVVRAPLTSVIILSETTGSRGLMLPLLATALIADFAAASVSRERLYHALADRFAHAKDPAADNRP